MFKLCDVFLERNFQILNMQSVCQINAYLTVFLNVFRDVRASPARLAAPEKSFSSSLVISQWCTSRYDLFYLIYLPA